jgi:hypothetical protein
MALFSIVTFLGDEIYRNVGNYVLVCVIILGRITCNGCVVMTGVLVLFAYFKLTNYSCNTLF